MITSSVRTILALTALALAGCGGASKRPSAATTSTSSAMAVERVAASPTRAIRGSIVDALHYPVADCEVALFTAVDVAWGRIDDRAVARTASGANGAFVIVPPMDANSRLVVLLRHPRFPSRVLAASAGRDLGDIELASMLGAVVEVVRASPREPVADARVTVEPLLFDPRFGSAAVFQRVTRTAGDGRADVPALPPGSYRVRVEAAGLATTEAVHAQPQAPSAPPLIPVRLPDGHPLAGRILGADGEPAADVPIEARGQADPAVLTTTRSGVDGGFRLAGLPAGRVRVVAMDPAGRRATAELSVPSASPLRLELAEPPPLVGRVLARDSAEPIAGARIDVRRAGDRRAVAGRRSGRDGSFGFPALPAGRYVLVTSSEGYLPVLHGPVDLPRPDPLEIGIEPARSVTGTVRDPSGRPLPGAELQAMPASFEGTAFQLQLLELSGAGSRPTSRSTVDGRFRVTGPVEPFRLMVRAPGFAPLLTPPILRDRAPEITLQRGATIRGTVRSRSGTPPTDGWLCADPAADSGPPRLAAEVSVGADGGFEIGPLSAGPYVVFYHSEGRDRPAGDLVRDRDESATRIVLRDGVPTRLDLEIR